MAFALLASSIGCGPANFELPALDPPDSALGPHFVVPCAHPVQKSVAFDETTALGVSPQEAFARIDAQCSAPFKWTAEDADAGETEASVEVSLDHDSAVEVTYPPSDLCASKLKVEGDVVFRTADGKLDVRGRGTFGYELGGGPKDDPLDPLELPAELSANDSRSTARYLVRVGSACAGEIRRQNQGMTGAQPIVGSWSANGCPLGENAVEPGSDPALDVRMEQLAKAWHEAHLDAAWDTGNKTQLELDVHVGSGPMCENSVRLVTVPVDVRYGTSDDVVPVHALPAQVQFSLLSNDLSVRLLISEQTDCSTLADPAPGYCESLSSASLRFEITYPNAPPERLAQLSIAGQTPGSHQSPTTQRLLTIAGTPYAAQCLLTFDCAVDQICADGFCRAPAKTTVRPSCIFDSDCGLSAHCRAGSCSTL